MTPQTPQQTPPFEEHYRSTVLDLRDALTGLLAKVQADPGSPQELARQFGLNRNLTWKISRVIRSSDPVGVYSVMPGASGFAIFLKALAKAGAPEESIEAVKASLRSFEQMIKTHAGDRSNLELMLDSLMGDSVGSEPLEVSRKLAFRGNSGIWGLQARLRVRTLFIAPNPEDPNLVDTAQISGLVDICRFRKDAVLPLFETRVYNDDGSVLDAPDRQPLEPEVAGYEGSMLLPGFCSAPLPPIKVLEQEYGTRHVLGDGSIGNCGATTVMYGSFTPRFATLYRDENNRFGECSADINVPVETLLFDLIVHKGAADKLEAEPKLLQRIGKQLWNGHTSELPCPEKLQYLGFGPPRVGTPLMPRYSELVGAVFERTDWDPKDFRALRLEMKYPPVNSTVVLRYLLPEKGN